MSGSTSFHEDFHRPEVRNGGSSRAFGLVIGAVFAIVGIRPMLAGGSIRWWAIAIAAALVLVALVHPALLDVPNRLWHRLGVLLGRIMNPVILGLLFVVVITPTALITRLLGRDPLRLNLDRGANTYWIERRANGADGVDMRKQF